MASSIAGTATNWTITSPAGQLSGAAINHANASLEDDGTVVIKSADGVLWAGNIMTLGGLVGATPALRYADLLNNYLTGFSAGGATGPLSTITFLGSQLILSSPFSGNYLFPFTSTSLSNGTPFATLSGNRALFSRGGYFLFNNKLGSGANGTGGTDRITLRLRRTRAMVDSIIMEQSATCRVSNPAAAIIVNVQAGDEYWWDFNVNTGAATLTIQGFASFTYMNVIELNASTGTTVDNAVDTGEAIVTGSSPAYTVKRFKAGTNVTLSSDATSVTIDSVGSTIANNPGTGGELVNGTAPNYLIKRITGSGTNMTVTSTADTVNVAANRTDISHGDAPGAQAFRTINSFSYRFRRLTGGTGITVTEGVSDAPNTITNTMVVDNAVDTGESWVTGASPTFTMKQIKAGTNVTLSSDPTSVTINATGGDNGFWVRGGTVEPLTTSRARIGAGFFNRNNGNLTWNAGASEFGQDVKGYGIQFNCQINIVTPSTGAITLYLNSNNGTLNDLTWRTFPAGYNGAMTLTWISVVDGSVGAVIPSLEIVSTVADGRYSVGPFESGFISANRFL